MSRVRIVGGQWRSRLLPVIDLPGLRPTPERVRETLYNWLGQDLTGWRVLDLFAGSGALGFEAASRGAAEVVLVERDARASVCLRASAETLHATGVEIIRGDALKFATSTQRRFDLLLLDPPYKLGWVERVAPFIDRLLSPEGWLYVEAERPLDAVGAWTTVKRGQAGQVFYQLMQGSPP